MRTALSELQRLPWAVHSIIAMSLLILSFVLFAHGGPAPIAIAVLLLPLIFVHVFWARRVYEKAPVSPWKRPAR